MGPVSWHRRRPWRRSAGLAKFNNRHTSRDRARDRHRSLRPMDSGQSCGGLWPWRTSSGYCSGASFGVVLAVMSCPCWCWPWPPGLCQRGTSRLSSRKPSKGGRGVSRIAFLPDRPSFVWSRPIPTRCATASTGLYPSRPASRSRQFSR